MPPVKVVAVLPYNVEATVSGEPLNGQALVLDGLLLAVGATAQVGDC